MKQTLNPIQAAARCSLAAVLLLGGAASCGSAPPNRNPELEGRGAMWSGEAVRNAAMNNAIVAQHTLYPYHFANGSSELNDLGRRDLNVLASHFAKTPGDLNVRRGEASEALYEARVKAVLDRLAAAGVQGGSVAVKDGLPGGDGLASERVIVILKEKMSKTAAVGVGATSGASKSGEMGIGTGIQ